MIANAQWRPQREISPVPGFETPLRFEWIHDHALWRVLEPIVYTGEPGRRFEIAADFVTDFASIPQWAQSFVPKIASHLPAAVVHDWCYRYAGALDITRGEADRIFLRIMERNGVAPMQRRLMYRAVRVGGRSLWDQYRRLEDTGFLDG